MAVVLSSPELNGTQRNSSYFYFYIYFILQLFDLRLLINKLAGETLRVRELDIVFNGD